MGTLHIRIKYTGPGNLTQFTVAPPKLEWVSIKTSQAWQVGDEMWPLRPGWFVQEVTVEEAAVTYVVALTPPP